MKPWQMAVFVSFFGGFLAGFNTEAMSGALLFISKQFHDTTIQSEDLISAVLWGALIATIFASWFLNHFGRKVSLLTSAALLTIGPGFAYIADQFLIVDISRWITGVGVGLNTIAIFLYISEMAPVKFRSKLLILNPLAYSIGVMVSDFTDLVLSHQKNWHLMLGIIASMSLFQFIYFIFIPESEVWLKLRSQTQVTSLSKSIYNLLPEKKYRKLFLLGLMLAFITQAIGVDTLLSYAPLIFRKSGFDTDASAIAAATATNMIQAVSAVLIIFYIDKFKRKPLLIAGLISMGVLLIIIGISFWFLTISTMFSWLVLGLFFLLAIAYNFAFVSTAWVAISEIFHPSVKAKGLSLANLLSYLFMVILAQVFLSLIKSIGMNGLFCVLGAISCFSALIISIYFVETKDLHFTDNAIDEI